MRLGFTLNDQHRVCKGDITPVRNTSYAISNVHDDLPHLSASCVLSPESSSLLLPLPTSSLSPCPPYFLLPPSSTPSSSIVPSLQHEALSSLRFPSPSLHPSPPPSPPRLGRGPSPEETNALGAARKPITGQTWLRGLV